MDELVTLILHLHHETKKDFLVSKDGDEAHAVWIPKWQCEEWTCKQRPDKGDKMYEFTIPEGLAMIKELI